MMAPALLGILLSALAATGFALFAVLARPAMLYASFYLGTLVSFLASLLFIGSIALAVDASAFSRLTVEGLLWLALLGLLNFSVGRTFNFKAIEYIGVSRAAPLIESTPLVAGLMALLVYKEEITPLLGLGAVLVVAGVMLIFFLFALPRLGREAKSTNSRRGLLFFAGAGLAGAFGVTSMYFALCYSPVAVVSSVSAIYPLFALLWTHLFLRHLERVTPRIWLGTALVVAGVALVTLSQVY